VQFKEALESRFCKFTGEESKVVPFHESSASGREAGYAHVMYYDGDNDKIA
jgi:hypothetical protein